MSTSTFHLNSNNYENSTNHENHVPFNTVQQNILQTIQKNSNKYIENQTKLANELQRINCILTTLLSKIEIDKNNSNQLPPSNDSNDTNKSKQTIYINQNEHMMTQQHNAQHNINNQIQDKFEVFPVNDITNKLTNESLTTCESNKKN